MDNTLYGQISIEYHGKHQVTTNCVFLGQASHHQGGKQPTVHRFTLVTNNPLARRHDPIAHGLYSFTDPLKAELSWWSEMVGGSLRQTYKDIPQAFYAAPILKLPEYTFAEQILMGIVKLLKCLPKKLFRVLGKAISGIIPSENLAFFFSIALTVARASDDFLCQQIARDPRGTLELINQFYRLERELCKIIEGKRGGTVVVPNHLLSFLNDHMTAVSQAIDREGSIEQHPKNLPHYYELLGS